MASVDDEAFLGIQIQRSANYNDMTAKVVKDSLGKLQFLESLKVENEAYYQVLQEDFPDEQMALQILERKKNLLMNTLGILEKDEFWQHSKLDLERKIKILKENPEGSSTIELTEYKVEISRLKFEIHSKQEQTLELNSKLNSKSVEYQAFLDLKTLRWAEVNDNNTLLSESVIALENKKSSELDLMKRIDHLRMVYFQKQDEYSTNNVNITRLRNEVYSSTLASMAETERIAKLQNTLDFKLTAINNIQATYELKLNELNASVLRSNDEKGKLSTLQELQDELAFKLNKELVSVSTINNQIKTSKKMLNAVESHLHETEHLITDTGIKLETQKTKKKELLALNDNSTKLSHAFSGNLHNLDKESKSICNAIQELQHNLDCSISFRNTISSQVLFEQANSIKNVLLLESVEFELKELAARKIRETELLSSAQKDYSELSSIISDIGSLVGRLGHDIRTLESKKAILNKQYLAIFDNTIHLNRQWILLSNSVEIMSDSILNKKSELELLKDLEIQINSKLHRLDIELKESQEIVESINHIKMKSFNEELGIKSDMEETENKITKLHNTNDQLSLVILNLNEEYITDFKLAQFLNKKKVSRAEEHRKIIAENCNLSSKLSTIEDRIHVLKSEFVKIECYRVKSNKSIQTVSAFQNQLEFIKLNYSALEKMSPSIINHHVLRSRIAFNSQIHKLLVECQRLRMDRNESMTKLNNVEQARLCNKSKTDEVSLLLFRLTANFKAIRSEVPTTYQFHEEELNINMNKNNELEQIKKQLLLEFNKLVY